MRWYMPSFSGDFRLEPLEGNADHSVLIIHKPTMGEVEQLRRFFDKARKKSWTSFSMPKADDSAYRTMDQHRVELHAPVSKAGAELVKIVRAKKATLTGITSKDGQISVVEGNGEEVEKKVAEAEKDDANAAASVRRPTPCCPQCEVGAVGPASEVLLEFLTPQQHEDWAAHRAIIAEGGYTGHRYLLAHRKTAAAARIGRICYDLDSRRVMHFHDSMVPPEEEALAAKLILENREDWLCNEATAFASEGQRFKNPFGDIFDGVPDASLTRMVGATIGGFATGFAAAAKAVLK
jgi:hypothetical protein